MEDITSILHNFRNLKEYTEYLQTLVEADGEEISRGKDPNDKSKEEKEQERDEKDKESDGEDTAPAGGDGEGDDPAAEVDPIGAPGSQVKIGNKDPKAADDPKAVKVEVGVGKEDKIETKPKLEVGDSNY